MTGFCLVVRIGTRYDNRLGRVNDFVAVSRSTSSTNNYAEIARIWILNGVGRVEPSLIRAAESNGPGLLKKSRERDRPRRWIKNEGVSRTHGSDRPLSQSLNQVGRFAEDRNGPRNLAVPASENQIDVSEETVGSRNRFNPRKIPLPVEWIVSDQLGQSLDSHLSDHAQHEWHPQTGLFRINVEAIRRAEIAETENTVVRRLKPS